MLIRIIRSSIRSKLIHGHRGFIFDYETGVPVTCPKCGETHPNETLGKIEGLRTICPSCLSPCDVQYERLQGVGEAN